MNVMTYTCKSCGKQYDYIPGNNSTKDLCASCRVMTKSKYYKQKAVEYKGGACQICGYNKCNAALDFHHVNPKNKSGVLAYMFSRCSWDKIKEELDKCILVCANCHREIHQQGIQTLDNLIKLGYKSYSQEYKEEKAIKQKAIEENRKIREYKNNLNIANRILTIKNSKIDFSKFGWAEELSKIIGISSAALVRWIKKHMPDFYKEKCYKKEKVINNTVLENTVIIEYEKYKNMTKVANIVNISVDSVKKILIKYNISIEVNPQKSCIDMLTKNKDYIRTFNSLDEAANYIYSLLLQKKQSAMPKLSSIKTRIRSCYIQERKTAYGYIWITAT